MPSRAILLAALVLASCHSQPTASRPPPASLSPALDECGRSWPNQENDPAPDVAFQRGPGPVYVALGSPGTVHYTDGAPRYRGRYYYEAIIAVAPQYRGALSVNGRRRDGREVLKWHNGPLPGRQRLVLSLDGHAATPQWRYWAGDVLFAAPGCYTIRIQGTHLTESIAFRAEP
jgi:hypothetical protein